MLSLQQGQRQSQQMAPALRQSVKLLAMSLPELRQEIVREIAQNPMIEDIEHPLEKPLDDEMSRKVEREAAEESVLPDDEAMPEVNPGEDAMEKRQRFFDSQVAEETLQDRLESQIAVSDIPVEDRSLAEMLVGNINDDGYFSGSMPDMVMVSGESEEHIAGVLSAIMKFDPLGCGARNLKECLLAQMEKLDGSPRRKEVRKIIENHLEDIAAGRVKEVASALGTTEKECMHALAELRTLDPKPGRAYPGSGDTNRIVKPEIHAVKSGNRWIAEVDSRSLPDIRISPRYSNMISDPSVSKEAKAYLKERLAAAHMLAESVERRWETIRAIAQEIFDRQPGFFERGMKGLVPMTMTEVAGKTGVHPATVSRTVNDKYVSTPRGVLELRRFFIHGLETSGGEVVAKDAVYDALKAVVDAEDKKKPLSDEAIAAALSSRGYPVARRTVAKYRGVLGIPGIPGRRA